MEELNKAIRYAESCTVEMLDTEAVYSMFAPEVTDGQKVYISVTQNNFLEMGVHVATVSDIRWYVDVDKKTVRYDALLNIGENVLSLSSQDGENGLSTGYTYHEVHLDMREAIERVESTLTKS